MHLHDQDIKLMHMLLHSTFVHHHCHRHHWYYYPPLSSPTYTIVSIKNKIGCQDICQKADSVNVKNHKNKNACIYSTICSPFVLQNPTFILVVSMPLMLCPLTYLFVICSIRSSLTLMDRDGLALLICSTWCITSITTYYTMVLRQCTSFKTTKMMMID